jgi:heptosyltransferase II
VNRLVILAPNWLGDAVMALPAIADVRREAPRAEITVAARPSIAPLFDMVPDVDRVVVLDARLPIRKLGRQLAQNRFELALLLPNSIRAALVVTFAGIPERWGYRADLRGALLTRAIDRPKGLHQAGYYQHLVQVLGFPNGPMEPHVSVPPGARRAGAQVLADAGWDGRAPIVALAPGAAYGGAKRWPPERFAEVAVFLAADGVQPVMIGTSADAATADVVSRAFSRVNGARALEARHLSKDRARDSEATDEGRRLRAEGASASLAEARGDRQRAEAGSSPAGGTSHATVLLTLVGRTDLPTLAGVLANCRALVTNDSGAMHLAAAVGTTVTAVFGPTDERATRPLGDAHRVETAPVWCRPCMLRECPIDHRCMRGVDAETVAAAARRSL